MKLASFSDKPFLIINQSPHGVYQNNKAMDFGCVRGNAPADGKIVYNKPQKNPQQSYFSFGQDGWAIQFVHSKPTKAVGNIVKRGVALWNTTWHHTHAAIDVNGKWNTILSCIDWNTVPVYWLKEGQKHPVWTNKGTYPDIELPPFPIINKEPMVKVIYTPLQKLTSTNTVPLKIRLAPVIDPKNIIGTIDGGYTWESNMYAEGVAVEGETKWYPISTPAGANAGILGYVSAKFVKAEPADNTTELQHKVAVLTEENKVLSDTNAKYKPAYDGATLINSVK